MRDTLCEKQGVREAAIRRRDSLSLQTFNFQLPDWKSQLPDWKSQRKIQQASEIRDRKILTMENEKEEVIILSRGE